ncbi:MAG: DUF3179 domain-containing protein, partial [Candidatus Dadabacteria bacterium]
LWQQITGEALVGDYVPLKLKKIPSQIISFKQFYTAYPNGKVLSRNTGYSRPYGRNPYRGYDNINSRPFLFKGKLDNRLPPMERLVVVEYKGSTKAYPFSSSKKACVINDTVSDLPIVIFHTKGALSAVDNGVISRSREIGSVGVFKRPIINGKAVEFFCTNSKITDKETGTEWDITGKAVKGKLKGQKLSPVVHGTYFAFAWLAFKRNTEIVNKY